MLHSPTVGPNGSSTFPSIVYVALPAECRINVKTLDWLSRVPPDSIVLCSGTANSKTIASKAAAVIAATSYGMPFAASRECASVRADAPTF